jgi:hypothetical protein
MGTGARGKQMATYRSTLEIAHGGKGIPYGGTGEVRPDGGANHGFKNLKSDIARLADVPEVADDAPLRDLIFAINQPMTGLFSVGCLSGDVSEPQGNRVTGYIEIAFNSKTMVADAGNYFPLFFHFARMLHDHQFNDQVGFAWVLEGAAFVEADANGFTMTIYVNTGFFGSKDEARSCWGRALEALTVYLGSIPVQVGEPIYEVWG